VLYFAARQHTFYGDAPLIASAIESGDLRSDSHLGHYLVSRALYRGLSSFGVSLYSSVLVASWLGMAIGVWLVFGALRIVGVALRQAAALALGIAVVPSVMFFATVLEVHGLFFGACGLVAVAAAAAARSPTAPRVALVGVCTAVATFFHATGHLLVGPAVLGVFAGATRTGASTRRPSLRNVTATLAAVAVVHVGTMALVAWLLTVAGASYRPRGAAEYFFFCARMHAERWDFIPHVVWHEWLLPYCPWSLLMLAGLRRPDLRRATLGILICLFGYLVLAYLLLATLDEHGAYLLPLAVPAVVISAMSIPRWAFVLSIAASAALATAEVASHDRPERSASYAAGVRELKGNGTLVLLVGGFYGLEAHYLALEDQAIVPLASLATVPNSKAIETAARAVDHLRSLAGQYDQLVLTDEGRSMLSAAPVPGRFILGQAVSQAIEDAFVMQRVDVGGFRGWRLKPRQ
jgi:hypothetical protein